MTTSWFHRREARTSETEAERLVQIWGATAYNVARNLSFRETAGLLDTASPGFWATVAHAVGHRLGLPEASHLRSNLLVL